MDSRATWQARRRHGRRGQHSAARFAVAAGWFRALLLSLPLEAGVRLPLERVVLPGGPPQLRAGECDAIVFDASPWGGGAVLFAGRRPVQTFVADWTPELCSSLGAVRGESGCLTFFEAFTVLAALEIWCGPGGLKSAAVVGDNIGALTVAVSRRGRGDLGRICRELALRQAASGLELAVGHLPSHLNTWSDALSRLSSPTPATWPAALVDLSCRTLPPLALLFRIPRAGHGMEEATPAAGAEQQPAHAEGLSS